jgi:dipeptidyl aminopeptidase/acylaminoacyl peptidase
MRRFPASTLLLALPLLLHAAADDAATVYQKPSKEILDVLHAATTPQLDVNPSKTHAMLIRVERYPPISEVAAPMLRLAGLRISPATNGPHSPREAESMELVRLPDQVKIPVTIGSPNARMGMPRWSPDGNHFAFTNTVANGIQLWIGATATGKVRRIDGVRLNAVLGNPIQWTSDNKTLLVNTVPANRGAAPERPATPRGPKIQESEGRAAGIWTNPDALKDSHDEDLFDYYGTSQLAWVDTATGKVTAYGRPGMYTAVSISPDGAHVLTTAIHRPYTYLHYYTAFPKEVEVWNRATGNLERKVASLPLEDRVPVDGVPVGPRAIQWRPNEAATLLWVEALDGGNPKEKVPHRDRILMWKAPFQGEAREAFKVEQRYMGMTFVDQTAFAMVTDLERQKRWVRTLAVNLDNPAEAPKVVFSRDMRDRYRDPGQPVRKTLANGQSVVASSGAGAILLDGEGAGPKGSRPFLDRFDIQQQKAERVFQSAENAYENVAAVLDTEGKRFITRRESPTEPPNYILHDNGKVVPLTSYADPTPQLRKIRKQLVTYKRPDGVPLSFTLYLPPDYEPGKRLPTVVWAYPLEFNDADTAGQIVGSTQRFTTIAGFSHLFFLLQGYAILDNASMPVVGSIEKVNDTYIEQIVASAKAAIDKAAEMGVTDPDRVGVGGHSYGGFMTANLLAHSDLFRAGIARSGAYNRTLTPFGFQSERRTLWEAPETYLRMSPFLHAHKIKEPILLIHGEADNNQGTFPIQSERMYQAIRGNGGHVRYVVLPAESHGYGAKESVEHTLWEMVTWFDKHVKNAPARLNAGPSGQ